MAISENMKHTYIANKVRHFAFLRPVKYEDDETRVKAYDFFIFDEEGYAWISISHAKIGFLKNIFGYLFENRTVWTISTHQEWNRSPLPHPDNQLIRGDVDVGYMIESFQGKFGMDIEILRDLDKEMKKGE